MGMGMTVAGCPWADDGSESLEFSFEAQDIPRAYTQNFDLHSRLDWRVPRQWRMSDTLKAFWKISLSLEGVVKYDEW